MLKVHRVTHLLVIRVVKDLVVLQEVKVTQHKVLVDLQVIQHQDLRVIQDRQVLLVIKDRSRLQDLKVLKEQKETKVLKVRLVHHHKDLRDRKVTHHKVTRVERDLVDLRDLQEITHKDLQDQRDLVAQVVIRDLQEIREPRDLKVQPHRQGR